MVPLGLLCCLSLTHCWPYPGQALVALKKGRTPTPKNKSRSPSSRVPAMQATACGAFGPPQGPAGSQAIAAPLTLTAFYVSAIGPESWGCWVM